MKANIRTHGYIHGYYKQGQYKAIWDSIKKKIKKIPKNYLISSTEVRSIKKGEKVYSLYVIPEGTQDSVSEIPLNLLVNQNAK